MLTWKTIFKHFAVGAIGLLWVFASLILSVHAFNHGEGFYVACGIFNIIVTGFLAYKGAKYFMDEYTDKK